MPPVLRRSFLRTAALTGLGLSLRLQRLSTVPYTIVPGEQPRQDRFGDSSQSMGTGVGILYHIDDSTT